MMTGRNAFKIWAPAGARWSDWVRPVPFIAMDDSYVSGSFSNLTMPGVICITEPAENTAVIVDSPGYDSVKEGVALARLGFRPIPLFNGTTGQPGAMALVDNHAIENALLWGAAELEKITIPKNAPPVFLLDSNRTHRYKMSVSVFDNSWDIYDQDMPSAKYFLSCGINKIIVMGNTIQKDVGKILYEFQKKGIAIFFTNAYAPPEKVTIKKSLKYAVAKSAKPIRAKF